MKFSRSISIFALLALHFVAAIPPKPGPHVVSETMDAEDGAPEALPEVNAYEAERRKSAERVIPTSAPQDENPYEAERRKGSNKPPPPSIPQPPHPAPGPPRPASVPVPVPELVVPADGDQPKPGPAAEAENPYEAARHQGSNQSSTRPAPQPPRPAPGTKPGVPGDGNPQKNSPVPEAENPYEAERRKGSHRPLPRPAHPRPRPHPQTENPGEPERPPPRSPQPPRPAPGPEPENQDNDARPVRRPVPRPRPHPVRPAPVPEPENQDNDDRPAPRPVPRPRPIPIRPAPGTEPDEDAERPKPRPRRPRCRGAAWEAADVEAKRLEGIAEAARARVEALRAASAKARADPHYVYQAVSPYHVIKGAEADYQRKLGPASAARAKANALCTPGLGEDDDNDHIPLKPAPMPEPESDCGNSPAYMAAKAEADRLRAIANAAWRRVQSLREASARVRADPHYVYQAVSPYHVVKGAETDFNAKDSAAKRAEAKAETLCERSAGPGPRPRPHPAPRPPPGRRCSNSAAWRAADTEARRLEALAEAAKARVDSLRAASARARADPHYVYQAVSPYHVIKGAEADYTKKLAMAKAARAKADALCPGGRGAEGDEDEGENKPRPRPDEPAADCGDSPAYMAAKAEADRLRAIADAAWKRVQSLREASARARADPHYVYQAVSPYHVIKGAEADFSAKDAAAKRAEAKAEGLCERGVGPSPRPRPQPGRRCSDSAEWRLADREATRLEAIADAAKDRVDALRAASAKARADPHYVYQAVSPYHVIKGAEADYGRKLTAARAARARADVLCPAGREDADNIPRPRPEKPEPAPDCGDSPAYLAAKAEADRLRASATAAWRRVQSLREASARARADPHYVYQAVSPYHVIKGAEADFNIKDSAAKRAEARARQLCESGGGIPRPRPRPVPGCNGAAWEAADTEARRLEAIAAAAEARVVGLRAASARARADPHYVYQAVSPYHVIKGAEADYQKKLAAARAARARANSLCGAETGNDEGGNAEATCGPSPAYISAKAQADKLRAIATAAWRRVQSLREASARARADPHYVYQAVSPYHVIKGAEADFNIKDSAAKRAEARARELCKGGPGPRPRPGPTCADSPAWAAADATATGLEAVADAARRRVDSLNAASARARSDPHYVYQAVSPYHIIKGAQDDYRKKLAAATAARAKADALCNGGDGGARPRPPPPPGPQCSKAGAAARQRANAALKRVQSLRESSAKVRADPHYVYQAVSPYHAIKGAEAEYNKWNDVAKKRGC